MIEIEHNYCARNALCAKKVKNQLRNLNRNGHVTSQSIARLPTSETQSMP